MGRVSNVLFPFLVTSLASKSSSYVFILLAIVASIIAVAVIFLGVETRGESVEAIGDVE
jgi:putative MFS transporter